jgi:hypothetical protein
MEEVKQEFNGAVGDVAGRDIINHHHTQGRLLTKVERIELHKLVQRLETEFGEPGWQTWKFLHRTIGVENIDAMCLSHRDQADTILNLLLERASLQDELECTEAEFEQSGKALTKMAERNSQLVAQLQQAQQAYTALHAKVSERKPGEQCAKCAAAKEAVGTARRRMLAAGIAAVVCALAGAFFAYQAYAKRAAASPTVCQFNGQSFSVGSVIDGQDGANIECILGTGQTPQWKSVNAAANKTPIRRR